MKLFMSDVKKRKSFLDDMSIELTNESVNNVNHLYEKLRKQYTRKNAFNILENWNLLDTNSDILVTKVLEICEIICENDTASTADTATNVAADPIKKTRNAQELQYLIKRKISNIKTKLSTKPAKAIENINTAVQTHVQQIKSNLPGSSSSSQDSKGDTAKQETCLKMYNKLLNIVNEILQFDRVLNNHDKLSKRFNIDNYIKENRSKSNKELIFGICEFVDTYEMPFKIKYNVALENISYSFYKNHITYTNKEIVDEATSYFLKTFYIYSDEDYKKYKGRMNSVLEDMKYILENNKFYTDLDYCDQDFVIDRVTANKQFDFFFKDTNRFSVDMYDPKSLGNFIVEEDYNLVNESVIKKIVKTLKYTEDKRNEVINKAKDIISSFDIKDKLKAKKEINELNYLDNMKDIIDDLNAIDENKILNGFNPIKDILNSIKKIDKKDIDKVVSSSIRRIMSQDVDHIIHDRENIFQWLFMIIASCSVASFSLALGLITSITLILLNKKIQRKHVTEMIKTYEKNIDKATKKKENTKDSDEEERYNKLIKKLKEEKNKLSYYEEDLYSDEEYEKKKEKENKPSDTDDFDFDFNDMDFKTESTLLYLGDISEEWDTKVVLQKLRENIESLDIDIISSLTEASILYENLIPKDEFVDILESYKIHNTKISFKNRLILNENIKKLKNHVYDEKIPSIHISETVCDLSTVGEVKQSLNSIFEIIEEGEGLSIGKTLVLQAERLKKAIVNLSDKEKMISRELDQSLDRFSDNVEEGLSRGDREAVIRNKLLPSFSKIVKIAITVGIAWAVAPALAAITVIGSLAMSSKYRAKERQIVLDEIEVELDMCERYIRTAEEKSDLKAVKQLLSIKKSLIRQRDRLKYKLEIEYGKRTSSMSNNDDE